MKSMAYRLTIRYISAFIVFFGMASLLFYFLVTVILNHQLEEDLGEDLQEFSHFYKQGGLEKVREEIEKEMLSEDAESVFFAIVDNTGHILLSSDLVHWRGAMPVAASIQRELQEGRPHFRKIATDAKDYPYMAASVALDSERLMVLGETTEEQAEFLQLLLKVFVGVFAFAIPAATLAGWLMAQDAARNIRQISQTASRIQRGQFDSRVNLRTKDAEIQMLIDAFNAMLGRINDLMQEMRELTDNVAHDMRSPLARIRALSETLITAPQSVGLDQHTAAFIIKECDRLIQMINATLEVAEAESGVARISQERVDMTQLVADACELFETVASEKSVTLVARLAQDCWLTGNLSALQRMLANIIDNAIKYTPAQGAISVTLETGQNQILIAVADTGIGISLADQERIFERYFRCDHSRSLVGCGLGLSYSRAVAHSHGGRIEVTSTPGAGSCFHIVLPVASASF